MASCCTGAGVKSTKGKDNDKGGAGFLPRKTCATNVPGVFVPYTCTLAMPSPLKSPVTALPAVPVTDASGVPNTLANVEVAKPLVSTRVPGASVVPSYSVTVPLGALNGGITEAPGTTSIGMLNVPAPIGTTEISVWEGVVPCACARTEMNVRIGRKAAKR